MLYKVRTELEFQYIWSQSQPHKAHLTSKLNSKLVPVLPSLDPRSYISFLSFTFPGALYRIFLCFFLSFLAIFILLSSNNNNYSLYLLREIFSFDTFSFYIKFSESREENVPKVIIYLSQEIFGRCFTRYYICTIDERSVRRWS